MTTYNDLYRRAEKNERKKFIFENMTEEYANDILDDIVSEAKKIHDSLQSNGHEIQMEEDKVSCTLKAKSPGNTEFNRILKYEVYPPYERYKSQHKYVIDETITTELNGGLILRNNVWDVTKEYETHYLVSENQKDVLPVEDMMKSSYESFIQYII